MVEICRDLEQDWDYSLSLIICKFNIDVQHWTGPLESVNPVTYYCRQLPSLISFINLLSFILKLALSGLAVAEPQSDYG